ncbi:hypothetical protein VXE65_32720 [Mycolicibacterium conceptionense]|uniref:hypothetical protein n=1 Tax=Mycolicibacterium conceptionense TaxID=451644 RepID=UPI003204BD83
MTRGLDNDEWLRNIGAVPVAEDEDRGEVTDEDLDDLGGTDVAVEPGDYAAADGELVQSSVVFLDHDQPQDEVPPRREEPSRRFTPWVLAAFAAAAVVATVITLVVTVANSPSDDSPSTAPSAVAPPRVVEVAPPKPPANTDGPLPFTASADCPPGSTAAQSVGDPNSTTPWVCVRSVDGQVLTIDLGRTHVITAVSIVPGAVLKVDANPDQPDPWLQHRVVTRVQWQFNDTDRTVKNQNTGNVRGEAVEAIRPGVLASKITVIIQETSRPPAIAPTTAPTPTPAGPGPSILGDILGGNQSPVAPVTPVLPGAEPSHDPADGTFAVSSIKIIGHKAV